MLKKGILDLCIKYLYICATAYIHRGTGSLAYVDSYVNGCTTHCTQWYCPLAACVPSNQMTMGAGGDAGSSTISTLANAVVAQDLAGIMVWYASVLDAATGQLALRYGATQDASDPSHASYQPEWEVALKTILG
jgi:hypothetical protein